MKCKHCGNEIADGSKFCKRCGNKATHANHRLFFFVLFALLLVGGCIGVYYGIKNSKVPVGKVTITVDTNDSTMGTVKGGGECARYDTITIEAVADMNYRFVSWDDGCEDRIRQVVADHDQVYMARFDSIVTMTPIESSDTIDEVFDTNDYFDVSEIPVVPKFLITVKSANPQWGTVIGGNNTYDSLTVVKLEARAKDGYRFVKWNDGNKERSRKVIIVRDQTFLAEFEKIPPVGEPGKCIIQYSFGKYEGSCKNGIPEGHGIMYYNCHIQIAKYYSSMEYYAEQGDYFDGNWKNGDIYVGNLYDKNGVIKYENIKAKPRTRPYDLEKDEYIK